MTHNGSFLWPPLKNYDYGSNMPMLFLKLFENPYPDLCDERVFLKLAFITLSSIFFNF